MELSDLNIFGMPGFRIESYRLY